MLTAFPLLKQNITDKDIAKTALLAKGYREAGQTVANAFRTFADKPDRYEDVGEILRPFLFSADRYYRCYNKKDWRIKYADYTIRRYRNIHR